MTSDELFMSHAIELAQLADASVFPNPYVGAVIVLNEEIIAAGFHQKYGEAHAEVNAVSQVSDKSILKDCTIYVTLEPCAHYGKTPPCADLLVKHQFKRVVIGSVDPFALVNGAGVERLKNAGIEVEIGVLNSWVMFDMKSDFMVL
jgi:diaminohydroxyphosphoribosylaminopyrimidine deaminase/5-amino-6-(5-phosphoribosylamino)uracil reductase